MNVQARLKKIEQQLPKPTIFCECFDKSWEAQINKAYGQPFIKANILPDGTPTEGVCNRCKRAVSPQVRQFYNNLEKIYGGFDFNEYKK